MLHISVGCSMCVWLLSSVVSVLPCILTWLSCDQCPLLSGERVSSSVLSLMVWTERDLGVGGGGGGVLVYKCDYYILHACLGL